MSGIKRWLRAHPLPALLAVACAILTLGNSVIIPDIMESRNLVTAHEMVSEGHWLLPTMNGQPRLEKPPLPTWVAAWTMQSLGESWWMVRLVPALMGVLLLYFFYRLCQLVTEADGLGHAEADPDAAAETQSDAKATLGTASDRLAEAKAYLGTASDRLAEAKANQGSATTGAEWNLSDAEWQARRYFPLIAGLILLTCYNFVLASKTVSWDIYCHAFQLGGIYFLCRLLVPRSLGRSCDGLGQAAGTSPLTDALLAGLLTGLSIMSKGPVAPYALLLPFGIAWALWQTLHLPRADRRSGALTGWLMLALLTACVVGLTWYAYAYLSVPDVSEATLHKESGAWTDRNVRPWYYYWSFFTETGLWLPLCLASLVAPLWLRSWRARSGSATGDSAEHPVAPMRRLWSLGLIWTLSVLFVLSLMPEKKNRYLLPVLFPSAMMMGAVLCQLWADGHKWTGRVLGAVVGLFVLLAAVGMPLLRGVLTNASYSRPDTSVTGDLPAYWLTGEELRIELVYDMHRQVTEVRLAADSLSAAASGAQAPTPADLASLPMLESLPRPCLLMVCPTLPEAVRSAALAGGACHLGRYDSNRHAAGRRLYRPNFIYDLYRLDTRPDAPAPASITHPQ